MHAAAEVGFELPVLDSTTSQLGYNENTDRTLTVAFADYGRTRRRGEECMITRFRMLRLRQIMRSLLANINTHGWDYV